MRNESGKTIRRITQGHAGQWPNQSLREAPGLLSRIPKDGSENLSNPENEHSFFRGYRENDGESIWGGAAPVKRPLSGQPESDLFPE